MDHAVVLQVAGTMALWLSVISKAVFFFKVFICVWLRWSLLLQEPPSSCSVVHGLHSSGFSCCGSQIQ